MIIKKNEKKPEGNRKFKREEIITKSYGRKYLTSGQSKHFEYTVCQQEIPDNMDPWIVGYTEENIGQEILENRLWNRDEERETLSKKQKRRGFNSDQNIRIHTSRNKYIYYHLLYL